MNPKTKIHDLDERIETYPWFRSITTTIYNHYLINRSNRTTQSSLNSEYPCSKWPDLFGSRYHPNSNHDPFDRIYLDHAAIQTAIMIHLTGFIWITLQFKQQSWSIWQDLFRSRYHSNSNHDPFDWIYLDHAAIQTAIMIHLTGFIWITLPFKQQSWSIWPDLFGSHYHSTMIQMIVGSTMDPKSGMCLIDMPYKRTYRLIKEVNRNNLWDSPMTGWASATCSSLRPLSCPTSASGLRTRSSRRHSRLCIVSQNYDPGKINFQSSVRWKILFMAKN